MKRLHIFTVLGTKVKNDSQGTTERVQRFKRVKEIKSKEERERNSRAGKNKEKAGCFLERGKMQKEHCDESWQVFLKVVGSL